MRSWNMNIQGDSDLRKPCEPPLLVCVGCAFAISPFNTRQTRAPYVFVRALIMFDVREAGFPKRFFGDDRGSR